MMFGMINGARLNTLLSKKAFKGSKDYTNEEVRKVTGLTIDELIWCWGNYPGNRFLYALYEWSDNGVMMSIEEIQGY